MAFFQRASCAGGDRTGSSRSGSRAKMSRTATIHKIKRKAGVWAVLLLLSICIYSVIVFAGLSRFLPFANISQTSLERSALTKFLQEALAGVALPLVPSNDLFDHASVIVGPYGELTAWEC